MRRYGHQGHLSLCLSVCMCVRILKSHLSHQQQTSYKCILYGRASAFIDLEVKVKVTRLSNALP